MMKEAAKEDMTLRIGALVKVPSPALLKRRESEGGRDWQMIGRGPHKGAYGTVVGLDSDNNRAVVKLALGGRSSSEPVVSLEVVGAAEFEREAKCLNKGKYDEFKAAQAAQHADHHVAPSSLLTRITETTHGSLWRSRRTRS